MTIPLILVSYSSTLYLIHSTAFGIGKVAVTDILDKEGQELVEEINKSGGVAKYWHLDVSDEKEVEKVYAEVVKEFGKLDSTVNNAGISGVNKPTHELTENCTQ